MRRKLTIFTMVCLGLAAQPSVRAGLTDGLVGYWPFDGDFVDATGGGHDGVSQGTVVTFEPGKLGQAGVFNGSNSPTPGVRVDGGTGWNPSEGTGQLSLSFWIKWGGASGGYQGVVSKRDGWGVNVMMWCVEINQDTGIISFFRDGSYPSSGAVVPAIGQWQHYAVSFDGTTQRFYRNGVETGSGAFSFANKTDSRVVIGCSDAWNAFKGSIDEVGIWSRALTAVEVADLYNGGDGVSLAGNQWKATNPVPADKATGIAVDADLTLRWSPPEDPAPKPITLYDVYFGEDKAVVAEANYVDPQGTFKGTVSASSELKVTIAQALLARDKTYYWRVDALMDRSDPNTAFGDVWSFETKKSVPVVVTHPVDQVTTLGGSAVFSVEVESPTAYQTKWYRVGDAGEVGTGDTLTVAGVANSDFARQYYAVATNVAGASEPSRSAAIYFPTLVAHYTCDDAITAGSKTVADSSGAGLPRNATANGDTASATGIIGGGLVFDGNGDWVDCGTWNPSVGTGQFTVMFWANWGGSTGTWQGFMGKRDDWGAAAMMWGISCHAANNGRVQIESDGSWPWFGDEAPRILPVGQWSHVAVTFDGSLAEVYINGERTSDPQGFVPNGFTSAHMVLGATGQGGDDPYKGVLDDVRIYNYVLTPVQIATLYTDVAGGAVCPVHHQYDYDQDCYVDLGDLAIAMANWLACNSVPDCL